MVSKILATYIIIAAIIFSTAIVNFQQQSESENKFQVYKEKFSNVEWNNELTKNLPTQTDLGREWIPLWPDGAEEYSEVENPTMVKTTVAGKEVLSTSYNYMHQDHSEYQILIWKGEWVSNWDPNEAIDNVFLQVNAKTEKVLEGLDLIPYCKVGYYDYYGDGKEIKNDLLFSECAKKDFRVRINLVEGGYTEESVEKLVFLSNLVTGKI